MNRQQREVARRTTVISLCITALFSYVIAVAQPPADAYKIMEAVYGQDKHNDLTMKADFQVFDAQGQSTKKEFNYLHIADPKESKSLVVFTAPKDIRGVALLSINQRGSAVSQYVYMPATQRVRSVVQQDRAASFIGTDFTFEDISERVLEDFNYRLIGDTESIDGHKTFKIEATPAEQGRSQYKYIYYWVAQDVPVILFAEFYNAQGNKLRILHATQLKRESGVWGARHTEMRTPASGTRTVLTINAVKFNSKPDEKLFTQQGMGGALGTSAGK